MPEAGEDVAATIGATESLSEEEQEELRRELAKVQTGAFLLEFPVLHLQYSIVCVSVRSPLNTRAPFLSKSTILKCPGQ